MNITELGRRDGIRWRRRFDRSGVKIAQRHALAAALDAGECHFRHVERKRLTPDTATEYGLGFLATALAAPCVTCAARASTKTENCDECEALACAACGHLKHEPDKECGT